MRGEVRACSSPKAIQPSQSRKGGPPRNDTPIEKDVLFKLGMKVSIAISNAAQLLPFEDLEGTIAEAHEIRQIAKTTEIVGSAATKQALKIIAAPHDLHIASHAYSFGLDDGASKDMGMMPGGRNPIYEQMGFTDDAVSDPYFRTGLALTGANWRRRADGIGSVTDGPLCETSGGAVGARDSGGRGAVRTVSCLA